MVEMYGQQAECEGDVVLAVGYVGKDLDCYRMDEEQECCEPGDWPPVADSERQVEQQNSVQCMPENLLDVIPRRIEAEELVVNQKA